MYTLENLEFLRKNPVIQYPERKASWGKYTVAIFQALVDCVVGKSYISTRYHAPLNACQLIIPCVIYFSSTPY